MVLLLESFYVVERTRIAELLRSIVAYPVIVVAPRLLRAIEVYEVDRLDFAETRLVANAEASGVEAMVSVDRTVDRVPTAGRIEPS